MRPGGHLHLYLARLVYLVYLAYLAYLVYLAYLAYFAMSTCDPITQNTFENKLLSATHFLTVLIFSHYNKE